MRILILLLCLVLSPVKEMADLIETRTLYILKGEIAPGSLLGVPINIVSFPNGDFVLHELQNNSLKIFDNRGRYLESLGGRGRGPGEFLRIQELHINREEELLVFDHIQRKVSVFREFEHIEDRILFSNRSNVNNIHERNDGSLIVRGSTGGEYLYYRISKDLQLTDNAYVHESDLYKEGNNSLPANVIPISTRRHSVLTVNDDLVVAPPLYTGEILIYREKRNYSAPERINVAEYGPAYIEYTGNPDLIYDREYARKEILTSVSTPDGTSHFYHLNRSLGLFRLSTGEILHLSQVWDETQERAKLMVEVMNGSATELLSVQELETLGELYVRNNIIEGTKHERIQIDFLHMDRNDNLFIFVEGEDLEPELHVVSVDLNRNGD